MQYADAESLGFAAFTRLMIRFYACDVENTWLISLIWTSGCRQTKGTRISNMRSHGKHSGLRTDERPTMSGWQQRWAAMAPGTVQLNNFFIESEAYRICEGWATSVGNVAFPTNAMRRNDS
jgi:hypothetical protein